MNNKKYWLRGGVVGLVISILFLFVLSLWPGGCIGLSEDGRACVPLKGMDLFLDNINLLIEHIGYVILYLAIPCILVGILFGWLYGKIKNR